MILPHESDLLSSLCSLTATKERSNKVFTYIASDSETYSQKVGAGTVRLEAFAVSGWIFSHWEDDVTGTENPEYYKTRKYGLVTAVFDRISWDVTATVISGLGSITGDGVDLGSVGTISVYHGGSVIFDFYPDEGYEVSNVIADGVSVVSLTSYEFGPITGPDHTIDVEFELLTFDIDVIVLAENGQIYYGGNPVVNNKIIVDYGSTPTLEFVPVEGNNLSSVLIDGTFYVDLVITEFTQTYQFTTPIREAGHSVEATFSVDGQADIPAGSDVTVFLSSAAILTFNNVGDGSATGEDFDSPDPNDVVVWEITVVAELGDQIIVALRYDPADISVGVAEEDLRLYNSDLGFDDYLLYLRVDFNGDGVIDGQDVKKISNIVKHPKFLPDPEDETADPPYQGYIDTYDLDGDDDIDEDDIHIVNSLKNVEWTDITFEVDTLNNIIYGLTDHFSIFRCR